MNLLHLQLAMAYRVRLQEIDQAIAESHAEGYAVEADKALDERLKLVAEAAELREKLLA